MNALKRTCIAPSVTTKRVAFFTASKFCTQIPVARSVYDLKASPTHNAQMELESIREHQSNPTGLVEISRAGLMTWLIPTHRNTLKQLFRMDATGQTQTALPPAWIPLIGTSLSSLPPSNPEHKRLRKVLNPFFMAEPLRGRFHVIRKNGQQFLENLSTPQMERISPKARNFAFDVVFGVIFDEKVWTRSVSSRLLRTFHDFSNAFSDFNPQNLDNPATKLGKGKIARDLLLHDVEVLIRECVVLYNTNQLDTSSIIYKMIDTQVFGDANHMTEDEWTRFKDNILLLVWAGHDTTGSSVCNLMYCLHEFREHPFVTKLKEELKRNQEKLDSFDFVMNDPMLDALVKEVVRYSPTVRGIPKKVNTDTEINGCPIHKGTTLHTAAWVTAQNESVFGESAKEFDPQRFIDNPPSKQVWYPFGCGTKICLGWKLAYLELKVMATLLLTSYHIELDAEHLQKAVDSPFNYYDVHGRVSAQ
eukprot:CAMPEP_0197033376 /NCGR_PEP_ID=MMETSP1384-20130603/11802_1 /TAXON_ID=29189 /ORGANISM="Ammonia sp." /LENGTH=474 /DNA_ID=CAMNT_0042463179 /DNA_START=40 /DNA_END=1464 /DNA_ORIENTATION=+